MTPPPKRRTRIRLGHVPIDVVTMAETLDDIEAMITSGTGGMVFTPNVDHVVLADENVRLREAYQDVTLSLADGMPILWASSLLRLPLTHKISGSDLLLPLVERASQRGFRVYLLGGADGVGERAAAVLKEKYPSLIVCGIDSPRVGLDDSAAVRAQQAARVKEARPDIVFVALGNPKQELWIHQTFESLKPGVLLGIGASMDFVAGVSRRAPPWVSRMGLEWLFRLGMEPRRLWRRYLLRDPKFLAILLRTARRPRRELLIDP